VVSPGRAGLAIGLGDAALSGDATVETWVFGFEIGLTLVRLRIARTLPGLADLACDTEKLLVEGRPIYAWAGDEAREARKGLEPLSRGRYEAIYEDRDVYPVIVLRPFEEGLDAARWIDANRPAIVGITGGEDDWARLSPFALESSGLRNMGYYKDELVIAKEWGALVSSAMEERAIVGLILFAYAQRWALASSNFLVNRRLGRAQALLSTAKRMRGGLFATMFGAGEMRRLSTSLFEAHEDRVHMTATIRDFTSVPELTQDWHLHNLYQELARTFTLNDLYKVVLAKNEELERIYGVVHDQVSAGRMMTLELYIVWLFILDIVLVAVEFVRSLLH